MLEQGTIELATPDFDLGLVRSSQTVASLKPKNAGGFDFTPADILIERSQNGYYHLGDLDLRLRSGDAGEWKSYSTAVSRTPVAALPGLITDSGRRRPYLLLSRRTVRSRSLEAGCSMAASSYLRFELKNRTAAPVEIGALGIPMIFNNVLNNRSLDQAHTICSFQDPYIGADAGYLQVTRLSGHGPALVVVPDGRTPFEAYNPILSRRGTGGAVPILHRSHPAGHDL